MSKYDFVNDGRYCFRLNELDYCRIVRALMISKVS